MSSSEPGSISGYLRSIGAASREVEAALTARNRAIKEIVDNLGGAYGAVGARVDSLALDIAAGRNGWPEGSETWHTVLEPARKFYDSGAGSELTTEPELHHFRCLSWGQPGENAFQFMYQVPAAELPSAHWQILDKWLLQTLRGDDAHLVRDAYVPEEPGEHQFDVAFGHRLTKPLTMAERGSNDWPRVDFSVDEGRNDRSPEVGAYIRGMESVPPVESWIRFVEKAQGASPNREDLSALQRDLLDLGPAMRLGRDVFNAAVKGSLDDSFYGQPRKPLLEADLQLRAVERHIEAASRTTPKLGLSGPDTPNDIDPPGPDVGPGSGGTRGPEPRPTLPVTGGGARIPAPEPKVVAPGKVTSVSEPGPETEGDALARARATVAAAKAKLGEPARGGAAATHGSFSAQPKPLTPGAQKRAIVDSPSAGQADVETLPPEVYVTDVRPTPPGHIAVKDKFGFTTAFVDELTGQKSDMPVSHLAPLPSSLPKPLSFAGRNRSRDVGGTGGMDR